MNEQLRVLILEDDEIDAELMERELRKANIALLSKRVGTGETFQKELKDFSPDIILADYTLPAFDGCSALKIVKERYPDIPFIFVSGTIGEDFAIESLKNGAIDYVLKDRISRLAPAVRRALKEVEERIEYRRAERALRESEARFRSLVESANDAIILTDGNGCVISWNKSAQRIFGYNEMEVLSKPVIHIMPERYRSDHQKRMEYISLNGNPKINGKTVESYGLRKDGSEFPLEISIVTWKIEGKTFYSAIIRDITERKRSEETLRWNHDLLNAISDAQSHFITDSNPKVLFDKLLANLISLTRSEYGFIGEVIYNAKGEPYLKTYSITNIAWDEKTREFYERNAPSGMEFYNLKTLFGTVMATGKPVIANNPAGDSRRGGFPEGHPPINNFLGIPFYQGEKLVGMAGIANRSGGYEEEQIEYLQPLLSTCANIIEAYRNNQRRKRAEEELKIKAQLLDDSTDSVFVHDLDGNFIYLNEMAYKSRGFAREEMMGINLHELVIPKYERLLKSRFEELLENGEGTFESAHFRKDKSIIPAEAHARIIESGGRKLVLSIIRDITERKRAEELLKEKARAELYGFIVSALPVFASGIPSQVRDTLVKNFGERFEKNIMPRFEEEMGRYSRDRSIRGAAIDIRQDELDFFISWLIGMFSNLGIRTRTASESTGRVFELLNCPWKGEASGNPIFCFICRTIMRRSLTWMPFKGSTEQKSSIANGSQVCGFDIHVK